MGWLCPVNMISLVAEARKRQCELIEVCHLLLANFDINWPEPPKARPILRSRLYRSPSLPALGRLADGLLELGEGLQASRIIPTASANIRCVKLWQHVHR